MPFVANPPTLAVVALTHSDCSAVGSTVVGCKPGGTGTLTITGTNFYGNIATMVSVNVGCAGALSVNSPTFTEITCTLAGGAAGSTTAPVVVTTNGGSTVAAGHTISYGKYPLRAIGRLPLVLSQAHHVIACHS